MKVAVTYENGEVFQHFGRTPAFKVYEISDGAYVVGSLPEIGDATCDHHEHEDHGEHRCGHGECHN